MQMARTCERSISGTILYLGAKKDKARRIAEDLIANELNQIVRIAEVPPGEVIATGAGELTKTHHVKKIFHAAAVRGQVGKGYTAIEGIGVCIRKALELADSEEMANEELHSILFPLMGTGVSRLSAQEVADDLINAAISYMEDVPTSKINKIYFLVYNKQDKEICRHKFFNDPRINTPDQLSETLA